MTNTFPFEWFDETGLMIVTAKINGKYKFRFLLDTGASHTSIDKNMLVIEDIPLKNALRQVELETANGRIMADVFEIDSIQVFGYNIQHYEVQIIDFIALGVTSNYAGMLGMDIMGELNFCFNFDNQTITIN
jgi:clan AA aspartic protease (TIGR02281 family)